MKDLYLIGAGDFSREIAQIVGSINEQGLAYRIKGYIDDDPGKKGKIINGLEVLGDMDCLIGMDMDGPPCAVIGVSDPPVKERIAEKLEGKVIWETLIHPSATISPYSTIEEGSVVQAYSFVSVDVALRRHTHINIGACIGHDAELGMYSSVMVHAAISGRNHIGRGVFISSGVTTVPGISIGDGTLIGAGAVVTKDLPAGVKAFGNPCRVVGDRL